LLSATVKIYGHPKGKTLYLSIPSHMVQDSCFMLKEGDEVKLDFDASTEILSVSKSKK